MAERTFADGAPRQNGWITLRSVIRPAEFNLISLKISFRQPSDNPFRSDAAGEAPAGRAIRFSSEAWLSLEGSLIKDGIREYTVTIGLPNTCLSAPAGLSPPFFFVRSDGRFPLWKPKQAPDHLETKELDAGISRSKDRQDYPRWTPWLSGNKTKNCCPVGARFMEISRDSIEIFALPPLADALPSTAQLPEIDSLT